MSPRLSLTAAVVVVASAIAVDRTDGFSIVPPVLSSSRVAPASCGSSDTSSQLRMGLFDGMKEAFSAPALERTSIDSERETPIDRWMGWSVVSENQQQEAGQVTVDFIDAMDDSNYVAVDLPKPMGIVFEENDAEYGGIFVQSLKEDGVAAVNGVLQEGDQLIAVNKVKVSGMTFDDALGEIVNDDGDTTKLVVFRGSAKQFYGPTGASKEWLNEFVAKGGVDVTPAKKSESSE